MSNFSGLDERAEELIETKKWKKGTLFALLFAFSHLEAMQPLQQALLRVTSDGQGGSRASRALMLRGMSSHHIRARHNSGALNGTFGLACVSAQLRITEASAYVFL